MKTTLLACLICVQGLLPAKSLWAQDTRDSGAIGRPDTMSPKIERIPPKRSYWQAGLNYISDNVYLGRKDSVKIPYAMPTIGYYHKSGLYADISMGYAVVPGDYHIDMVSVEAGYALSAGNFDGQLSGTKFYYSSQSFSVRSEIQENIVVDAAYDLQFIKPGFEASFNFGSATDYIMTWGLQHTFYAAKDAMDISPGITMNTGTQNYYNSYYRNRKYSVTRKSGAVVNGRIVATVVDPSAFKILDYEATLPINYTLGKFVFNFTPTLAIPVNPARVSRARTPTGGTTTTKVVALEKLNNSLFWNLGVQVKF